MKTNVLLIVACALFISADAAGLGRRLQASARAVAVARDGSSARASATSIGDADVTSKAGAEKGAKAVAITVGEGRGTSVKEETVVVASGEDASVLVAKFVSKVKDGEYSPERVKKEVIVILGDRQGRDFVNTLAIGLRDGGDIAPQYIAAAESLLDTLGCDEFKKPFIGFTLPIARRPGGCGEAVNACIFDACPKECCTSSAKAKKTCGCSGKTCNWGKGKFSKADASPFFWKCKDCKPPAQSCICK